MSCLEVFEALLISVELARYFAGVIVPFLGRSEADADSRVVLGMVKIYDLPKNCLNIKLVST